MLGAKIILKCELCYKGINKPSFSGKIFGSEVIKNANYMKQTLFKELATTTAAL